MAVKNKYGSQRRGAVAVVFIAGCLALGALAALAQAAHAGGPGVAPGWTLQQSNVLSRLYGVDFIDSSNGWAVGANGTIIHTSNGGMTWANQTSGVILDLNAVKFVSGTEGWAVGQSGMILHTTNGGGLWMPQNSGTVVDLYDLSFVSQTQGWVAGGIYNQLKSVVINTTNAGTNWSVQYSTTSGALFGVDFVDASSGWSCGVLGMAAGRVDNTSNGGKNWSATGYGAMNQKIDFINATHGWMVSGNMGLGAVSTTVDGGVTWLPGFATSSGSLRDIVMVSAQTGWITGDGGMILKSINGGVNWTLQPAPTAKPLWGVDFVDSVHGWAVGDMGTVVCTSSGGEVVPEFAGVGIIAASFACAAVAAVFCKRIFD